MDRRAWGCRMLGSEAGGKGVGRSLADLSLRVALVGYRVNSEGSYS